MSDEQLLTDVPKPSGAPPPSIPELFMRCHNELMTAREDNDALIAYALSCEAEIKRLAMMLDETHDQFFDASHEAIHESRHQHGVAAILDAAETEGQREA